MRNSEAIDPADVFRRRRDEPVIVSYAQNAEDVRLWRVFSGKSDGVYVDVGAGHPERDSVTNLFYEVGWTGLNIEPGPAYEDLVRARPRDLNLDVAIRSQVGEATLWVSSPNPDLSSFELPPGELVPEGFSFSPKHVRCVRLDSLIEEHLAGRTIDFLKVDVEGAEREVLSSFDPAAVRPAVILVEAVSPLKSKPNHADWEALLTERGYAFAAFDGVNRFYVPVEHMETIDILSYPTSALDRYEAHQVVVQRSDNEALERQVRERSEENASLTQEKALLLRENESLSEQNTSHLMQLTQLQAENAALAARAGDAAAHVEAMRTTISWRITRPLRSVRRVRRRRVAAGRKGVSGSSSNEFLELERAFARRISQAAGVLNPDSQPTSDPDLEASLDSLESALRSGTPPDRAKAWISLVAVDGSFPDERSVDRIARRLRMEGPSAVRFELLARFTDARNRGSVTTRQLDVRRDRVVVDVGHTVLHDLHTGIQRVVRETVSRWVDAGLPVDLVHFEFSTRSFRLLSRSEYERLRRWRAYLGDPGTGVTRRAAEEASEDALIPWHCQLILPELAAEPERCSAYRALVSASVLRSLSLIAYDLIPMVAAETVADGMPDSFARYLSIVKHADRVSAISQASADGFRGFGEMAKSEGLREPEVVAHPLPSDAPSLDPGTIDKLRRKLGIGVGPVILVVGSHEPRKNHLAVLEAAERLWADGGNFELLFIGGSGWKGEEFDELVSLLVTAGRPLIVRKRCSEEELWAAYSLARFTVFPSIVEGFGLPVAESLASGTPAVTSAHGSMGEIAEGGGCLVVDPRDVDSLENAMSQLLRDDHLLERLRLEAASRPSRTWDDYAGELWRFLVESGPSATPASLTR